MTQSSYKMVNIPSSIKGVSFSSLDFIRGTDNSTDSTARQLHATSAFLYAVIEYVARAVESVPLKITTTDGEEVEEKDLPFKLTIGKQAVSLSEFLRVGSMSRNITGTWYGLKLSPQGVNLQDGFLVAPENFTGLTELRYFDPSTVTTRVSSSGAGLTGFNRKLNGEQAIIRVGDDGNSAMFYNWQPSLSEVSPGVPPAQAAISESELLNQVIDALLGIYRNGAINHFLVSGDLAGADDDEIKRVKTNLIKQLYNRARGKDQISVVSKELTITQINSDIEKWAVPEVEMSAKTLICDVFGVDLVLVESFRSSNKSTLVETSQRYVNGALKSLLNSMLSALNKQWFSLFGLEATAQYEAMSVNQEDEEQRATALVTLVAAGMALQNAKLTLGYTDPDGYDPSLDGAPTSTTTTTTTGRQPKNETDEPPEETGEDMKRAELARYRRYTKGDNKRPFIFHHHTKGEAAFIRFSEGEQEQKAEPVPIKVQPFFTDEDRDFMKTFHDATDKAWAIENAMKAAPMPQPVNVTMNMADLPVPQVNIIEAERPAPIVNVAAPIVNVAAPIVNVAPTAQDQPDVVVNVDMPIIARERMVTKRGINGELIGTESETEFDYKGGE